jgi:hypothetical protein
MPARIELKITGLTHRALEDAILDSGLLVKKKKHVVNGETIVSLLGATVTNLAGFKAGDVRMTRSGLALKIDPQMIPPSSLSDLLRGVSK